jgi:hypothetical protein
LQENLIEGLSGHFTVPEGVTQVRFQIDQRDFAIPNRSPLKLFDSFMFFEVPPMPSE